MPPTKFLDHFLPILDPADESVRLPSKHAFRSVPREAKVASDVWEPMVSTHLHDCIFARSLHLHSWPPSKSVPSASLIVPV